MRIRTRFFLAFLATGLSVVLTTAMLAAAGFNRGLEQYLAERKEIRLESMAEHFAVYYAQNRRWPGQLSEVPGIQADHHMIRQLALLNAQKQPVAGELNPDTRYVTVPLLFGGDPVGYLAHPRWTPVYDPIDERFRDQQLSYLLLASGVALLLSLLVSWWLTRHLVQPVLRVVNFTRQLATGDYEQRLSTKRSDELGQLMLAIDHLAETLGHAERARDRWLADISHELRTPIAILRGEIEALIDGIRQPDSNRLNSLHQEVRHLQKLLDDLHLLALADAGTLRYQFETVDLAEIVRSQTDLFGRYFQAQSIALDIDLEQPANLNGDPERLRQLIANLLSNSLKYTAAGGKVQIVLKRIGPNWQLVIADTAPGVPAADCDRLFERLFRLESSRNRTQGGSGLGLAICQRIVEAHSGKIHARVSDLGGLHVEITIPEVSP